MLVFEDSKVRDAFDHRSRVRSTGRHHYGGDFLAVRVKFYLPGLGSACITVFEDNKGARDRAHNPVCAWNSKHIDIMHHFFRKLGFRGEFDIVAVASEQQHANFLTKALADSAFRFHRDCVMNI